MTRTTVVINQNSSGPRLAPEVEVEISGRRDGAEDEAEGTKTGFGK